jgi:hypothetical protein
MYCQAAEEHISARTKDESAVWLPAALNGRQKRPFFGHEQSLA